MNALKHLAVIITRALPQAEPFIRALKNLSATPIHFPVMSIQKVVCSNHSWVFRSPPPSNAIFIFTSRHAVENSLPSLTLKQQTILTMGHATEESLKKYGAHSTFPPPFSHTSETLLELPILQAVQGKTIYLFKGKGGRDVLANTLRSRGANLIEVAVYERTPSSLQLSLPLFQTWCETEKTLLITALSHEALEFLWEAADTSVKPLLLPLPLCLINERQKSLAQKMGFHGPLMLSGNTSLHAILNCIQAWYTQKHGKNYARP